MNPESLLPGVVDDLREVARAWAIDVDDPAAGDAHAHDPERLSVNPNPNSTATAKKKPPQPTSTFEVLSVLKSTTRAIRSIRNYVLSLPDDSAGSIRSQFRSNLLNPVPKKPPPTTTTTTSTTTSTSTSAAVSAHHPAPADPLTLIRRSALEVLTCLRELEEKSRVPLEDDAYDAQSDHGSSTSQARSTIASPSGRSHSSHSTDPTDPDADPDADAYPADTAISYSYIQVQGRSQSVPVWEDDASSDSDEEKLEKRSHWDERLVLGSGWLYRQDVRLADLSVERGVVGRYLGVVDDVLFGGREGGKRGWEREGERVERRKGGDRDGRKGRRVSEGGAFQFPGPRAGRGARRVASNEGIRLVDGASLSEEPGAMMDTLSESGEESESVDDDELPEWAKRSAFPSDPLGESPSPFPAPPILTLTLACQAEPTPSCTPSSPRPPRSYMPSPHPRTAPPSCTPSPPASTSVPRTTRACAGPASRGGTSARTPCTTSSRSSRPPRLLRPGTRRGKRESGGGRLGGRIICGCGLRKLLFPFLPVSRVITYADGRVRALKLRYLLPVVAPPAPVQSRASPGIPAPAAPGSSLTTSTTAATSPSFLARSSEPPIFFDAPLVARKEDGWEDMLENTVLRWMDAVVEERRGAR